MLRSSPSKPRAMLNILVLIVRFQNALAAGTDPGRVQSELPAGRRDHGGLH
jgi:hypothetical protein